jgi:hypothetical protein
MADIIAFPVRRIPLPGTTPCGDVPLHQARDHCVANAAPGKANRLDEMMQEIADLYNDSSLTDYAYCRLNLRGDEEDTESAETDFASLAELVVFSPEIQREDGRTSEPGETSPLDVRWGDVFFKCGDVYPFLFTVYTEEYVKHQLVSCGEVIKPSPRDIILGKKHLSPPDIIRAVLKWVNLYFPHERGKPVRLESPAVLQDLICDPGIEIVVPEPS